MSVLQAFITPPLPVIVPGIGRGREREISATTDSFHRVAARIAELEPDTLNGYRYNKMASK